MEKAAVKVKIVAREKIAVKESNRSIAHFTKERA